MATCEKCDATFTPSTDATEVTSTRILCPKCEAERRAERLKRAAPSATAPGSASPGASSPRSDSGAAQGESAARRSVAGASASSASVNASRDGAPPVPAKKRAPVENAGAPVERAASESRIKTPRESAPGATRESAGAARESAGTARESAGATRESAAAARESAIGAASSSPRSARAPRATAAASSLRASTSSAEPVARSARVASSAEPKHKPIAGAKGAAPVHPDVRREAEMLRARANRTMTYAWIACGVLAVIAAGFVFRIRIKKQAEADALAAEATKEKNFLTKMKAYNADDPSQADQAIQTAESDKWWKDTPIAGDVATIVTHGHAVLDLAKDKQEVADRLANAESIVKDFASKSADDIAKVRRTLEDLDGKGDMMGDDFKKRVATARLTVDRAYITRLHDEAKTQAAGGAGNARIALTSYTKAEEETLKLFEKNIQRKNKEAEDFFKGNYTDIIKESDALATSMFTPEEIAKTPWTDLLAATQKDHWQKYEFKGWRLENGVLDAVGADPGAGKDALMAIPDTGGYRDFQLECVFTMAKGGAKLCMRLGKRVDRQTATYDIDVGPKSTSFKAGTEYTALVTFVGSKLTIAFTPADANGYEDEVRWDVTRKGAFGIVLSEGAEIKITRLRIRELR
jgi:hypothetical protein